tara:strand:+ start:1549 stop:2202 length:654 start_codon:yes stop_codon:yes gene_type:complete
MARLSLTAKIALGFAAGFASFIIAAKIFPAYIVDGSSMEPTLNDESIQFGFTLDRDLDRYSIYTAKIPNRNGSISIKRLVGLPGDMLTFSKNSFRLLSVNGESLSAKDNNAIPTMVLTSKSDPQKKYYTVPKKITVGDFSFNIYEAKAASDEAGDIEFMKTQIYASWVKENGQEKEDTFEVTVPEGHIFMLSDNLPGSRDSRETGPYPIENVISKIL